MTPEDSAKTVYYLLTNPEWEKSHEDDSHIYYTIRGCDNIGSFPLILMAKRRSTNTFSLMAQVGEEVREDDFVSGGYKQAQKQASEILAKRVVEGFPLKL